MKKINSRTAQELADIIKEGGVGVLLTDTIYGLVADANNREAVEKVYKVRGRDSQKPCIVLIDSIDQIWDSAIPVKYKDIVERYWPGKVSIVLPIGERTPDFIHRNLNGTVVFRMPDNAGLRNLISRTGPLIAPSANPAGLPPAMDIEQAENYFGDSIDFYVDSGYCENTTPSRILKLEDDGSVTYLR